MNHFRLAALDLDGTLVDSAPDLSHCLGMALESVGLRRPTLAEATAWIGDGIETLVRRGLAAGLESEPADALLRDALDAFDRCYREHLFATSRLYPDVSATLDRLRTAGLALCCVTNKREAYAREMIARAGIADRLDFIIGGDSLGAKKPDPEPLLAAANRSGVEPAQAVMIGDTDNDRAAARAAGFAFVFAAYGYGAAAGPEPGDELATIGAFADLGALLCGH